VVAVVEAAAGLPVRVLARAQGEQAPERRSGLEVSRPDEAQPPVLPVLAPVRVPVPVAEPLPARVPAAQPVRLAVDPALDLHHRSPTAAQ
jgi:hypothetical protein